MGVAVILPLLLELLRLAPQFIEVGGEIVDGVQKIWEGVTSNHPISPEQQAQYDAALQEAHDALQRS